MRHQARLAEQLDGLNRSLHRAARQWLDTTEARRDRLERALQTAFSPSRLDVLGSRVEALSASLAAAMGRRLIVVLNDNEMSISPNVGALSLFLSRTLSQRWVRQTRKEVLNFLRSIPRIGQKLAVYAMRCAHCGLRAAMPSRTRLRQASSTE